MAATPVVSSASSKSSMSMSTSSVLASTTDFGVPRIPLAATDDTKTSRSDASTSTSSSTTSSFPTLKFDNVALRSLPIDSETKNYVRPVAGACFSRVQPAPVTNPRVVAVSPSALSLIGLSADAAEKLPEFAEYFSGNKVFAGAEPAAHCYCGHQFGSFAGQLGDGATMYLGEVLHNNQRVELQFKGAGKTPYSRTADGRKVLRSSIREFLCSEAMYSLGIPTTRSATCVTSDTTVDRDVFYTGNVIKERATIITRLAPTFIRFGSFEIFKPSDPLTRREGPSVGRVDILRQLLDYTIKTHYPEIWSAHTKPEDRYLAWYEEVIRRTARLVADWMCVGWCHGVLNTDNMSVMGLTIDYGPFAFLDRYDSGYICNGSDDGGRYAFKEQPEICKWNCGKLAEAIQAALPLSLSQPKLAIFDTEYQSYYTSKMRRKLGLLRATPAEDAADEKLIQVLFDVMETTGADFTNTFRTLNKVRFYTNPDGTDISSTSTPAPAPSTTTPDSTHSASVTAAALTSLLGQCSSISSLMRANAPKIPPQRLQMLIQAIQQDPSILEAIGADPGFIIREVDKFKRVAQLKEMTPKSKAELDTRAWQSWLAAYRSRLEREYRSCTDDKQRCDHERQRIQVMNQTNPRVILRNYMAQNAIEMAEHGDYSEVRRLVALLSQPFNDMPTTSSSSSTSASSTAMPPVVSTDEGDMCMIPNATAPSSSSSSAGGLYKHEDDQLPPDWAGELCVTCSS